MAKKKSAKVRAKARKSESKKNKASAEQKHDKENLMLYRIIGAVIVLAIAAVIIVIVSFGRKPAFDADDTEKIDTFSKAIDAGIPTGNGKGGIENDDPSIGYPDAPVLIVSFSDYQCPYCGAAEGSNKKVMDYLKSKDPSWKPAVPNIINDYIMTGKVRFVFRDYAMSYHENSQKAAEASECADDQGKFWQYHQMLFEHQDAHSDNDLKRYADVLGLDTQQFNECLDSAKYEQEVKNDLEAGMNSGVSGTPAFILNGQLIEGAYSYEYFKQAIEKELAK